MSNPRRQDLTTGSISGHLLRLSIPMIWGVLAIVSMQVADVYFISGLGQIELEAISFTFPVSMVLFNLTMGVPIATSAICARLIGAGQYEDLKHFIAHTLVIAALAGLCFALLGEILMPVIFPMLGAQAHHLPLIYDFMRISLWGYMFVILPMVANSALRAAGDSLVPSFVMIVAAIVNIPLSWALVYGRMGLPALGMPGAATANVLAYMISAGFALYVLIVRRRMLDGHSFSVPDFTASLCRLMRIAIPVGLMNLVQPLCLSVITSLLARSGAAAVAAYGVIGRIEALAFVPLMAISVGLGPIVGQNYGARRWDRIEITIKNAIQFCVIWSVVVGVALMIFGTTLTAQFTHAPETTRIAGAYFLTIGISIALGNITMAWGSTWNALGEPRRSAIITFVRFGIGMIALGWIGHVLAGWRGLFWGLTLGNLAAGLSLHFWSLQQFKRFRVKSEGAVP